MTQKNKRRTQKLWNMKGCALCKKCGSRCICGCHMRKMRGGSADCNLAYTGQPSTVPMVHNPNLAYTGSSQQGGMVPAMTPALFGTRWNAPVSTWPGVSGPHDGSFLKFNTYKNQPEMNPVHEDYPENDPLNNPNYFKGGKRRRMKRGKRTRKMRGGTAWGSGIFGQMGSSINNSYNAWKGQPANPSPLPFKDQMFYGSRAEDNLNYLKVG